MKTHTFEMLDGRTRLELAGIITGKGVRLTAINPALFVELKMDFDQARALRDALTEMLGDKA